MYKDNAKRYAQKIIAQYGGNPASIKHVNAATQKTATNVARSVLSTENYYKWKEDFEARIKTEATNDHK